MDESRPNPRDVAHVALPIYPAASACPTCILLLLWFITLVHVAISRQHTSQTKVTALEMHIRWCGDRGASAGIMLGRRPVEFVNRLSLLVLAVLLARAAPLDAASAQQGDLVYIEQADADGTSTLTVRLYQHLLHSNTCSALHDWGVDLQHLSSNMHARMKPRIVDGCLYVGICDDRRHPVYILRCSCQRC